MVGRNGVTKYCQNACALNILWLWCWLVNTGKEWWICHIGRLTTPFVRQRIWNFKILPMLISIKNLSILLTEHIADHFLHFVLDFSCAWPNIFQVNRVTILVVAQWLFGKVDSRCSGQCKGNH